MCACSHVLPCMRLLRWIPAAVILGCSWHLSSQSTIEYMPQFWNADKLVHMLCFAGLSFWVAFGAGTQGTVRFRHVFPACFVSCYGIIDEIHQSYVPGRSCSVFDWCADTAGAVLGAIVFYRLSCCILHHYRCQRVQQPRR